jgi:hypothetical protein
MNGRWAMAAVVGILFTDLVSAHGRSEVVMQVDGCTGACVSNCRRTSDRCRAAAVYPLASCCAEACLCMHPLFENGAYLFGLS